MFTEDVERSASAREQTSASNRRPLLRLGEQVEEGECSRIWIEEEGDNADDVDAMVVEGRR
jgi:hypothetical protein